MMEFPDAIWSLLPNGTPCHGHGALMSTATTECRVSFPTALKGVRGLRMGALKGENIGYPAPKGLKGLNIGASKSENIGYPALKDVKGLRTGISKAKA